jgi:hypothetical protein
MTHTHIYIYIYILPKFLFVVIILDIIYKWQKSVGSVIDRAVSCYTNVSDTSLSSSNG